jgi:alkanesulfonate monooxygenase SsuD/methylene tetrahydromethanopterin reductase-like flavin-dependent oxidoreductase (luciferase family)
VILDVQFNSATTPWPAMRDAVWAAEDAGFGAAWVVDHMAGQVMRGSSMLECFTLTGALAASTSTIGVGTLVANVWNRSLGALAVAAATAQEISGGRFWLGIGAGASPSSPYGAEHAAVGIQLAPTMAERHQRVRDFLALSREMWTEGVVEGVTGFPVPSTRIPILVGVNSVALACIAAVETDGINIRANHPRLDEIVEAAREARPAHLPPLLVTTWDVYSEALLDPGSAVRERYDRLGIDRLMVVQFDPVDLGKIHR